ncbi:MAG TPA: Calx-beta domain-containing protein [Pyrinomonadaceae bacterium]
MPLARLEPPGLGRGLFRLALCVSLCAALGALPWGRLASPARAATTFTVNSAGDTFDANTDDGVCDDGTGKCSLRAAVMQANATPGADTITFQIGTGTQTITPAATLVVTGTVTIDATTQPGYAGKPLVVLSGNGVLEDGLSLQGATSRVRGLVVKGFRGAGIRVGAAGVLVEGNYIGTDAEGTTAAGNGFGIIVDGGGSSALIGGTSAAARNVISGNGTGVLITGDGALVRGNYIGLAADGATPLPNTGDGVLIRGTVAFGVVQELSTDNVIGGTGAGAANVIAFNGGNGVNVTEHARDGLFQRFNAVRGNSIYSNGLGGISLARPTGGVEANDTTDADEGPNGLQNHPLLNSYAPSGGGTAVVGSLASKASTTYAVDFYASASCDGSGHGEGQAYVGTASVTTNASGQAQINELITSVPPALPFLTATATDPTGNTSEFSPCLNPSAPSTVQFKRAAYEASESGSGTVTVTVTRTQGSTSGAASVDYATSDGVAKVGLDYVAANGTLDFAPGETVKSFDVQLLNDTIDEDTQGFNVTLNNPTGGVALGGNSTTSVNVLDDDRPPVAEVDITGPIVAEGNTGTTPAVFKVRLNSVSERSISVSYSTINGTATPPQDYVAVSGSLTFAPGETVKTVGVPVHGDVVPEPEENFFFRVDSPGEGGQVFSSSTSGQIFDDDGAPGVHFASASYEVAETAGHLDVRVVRRGDTTAPVSIEYRMGSFVASAHDYTPVNGRLDFAPGETEKSIVFLVNDDAFVEEPEPVTLLLDGEATGTLFEVVHVNITSDDAEAPTAANNPVDDAAFFVRQHYHDFLAREPDPDGFAFWKSQIEQCDADAECRRVTRASVSAAFFLSIEFQRTGYQVFRAFAATYPEHLNSDANGRAFQLPHPSVLFENMRTIQRDVVVGQPGWEERLRDNTLVFAREWVESGDFRAFVPEDLSAAAYVETLFANAGVAPTQAERDAALAAFGAGGTEGRAAALLSATGSRSFYNRQYNAAFVAMQYYGYLRRAPNAAPDTDFTGYDFWLSKLDSFSLPGEDVRDDSIAAARAARAEMARAFVESAEYRARFGK